MEYLTTGSDTVRSGSVMAYGVDVATNYDHENVWVLVLAHLNPALELRVIYIFALI